MSAKRSKRDFAYPRCFIGPTFAADCLRLISSFFSLTERATAFERVAPHFKAASRHPSSFGDALVNFEDKLTVSWLTNWLKLYSSPPLRRLRVYNTEPDNPGEDASPDVLLATSAFGSTLRMLQFAHAGSDLASWSVYDLFAVARLTQLQHLEIGELVPDNCYVLEPLVNLRSLVCQTDVVNFLEVASEQKLVQRLLLLGVTFAKGGPYKSWYKWEAEFKLTRRLSEPESIKPVNPKQLPRLDTLWIYKPDELPLPDTEIPEWIRKKCPDLKPPWLEEMCPNIRRFSLNKAEARDENGFYCFPTKYFS